MAHNRSNTDRFFPRTIQILASPLIDVTPVIVTPSPLRSLRTALRRSLAHLVSHRSSNVPAYCVQPKWKWHRLLSTMHLWDPPIHAMQAHGKKDFHLNKATSGNLCHHLCHSLYLTIINIIMAQIMAQII